MHFFLLSHIFQDPYNRYYKNTLNFWRNPSHSAPESNLCKISIDFLYRIFVKLIWKFQFFFFPRNWHLPVLPVSPLFTIVSSFVAKMPMRTQATATAKQKRTIRIISNLLNFAFPIYGGTPLHEEPQTKKNNFFFWKRCKLFLF